MARGAWARATAAVAAFNEDADGDPFGLFTDSSKTAPYDSLGLQALQNQIDDEEKKQCREQAM